MILDHKINDKKIAFVLGEATLRLFARKKQMNNIGLQEIGKIMESLTLSDMDLMFYCGIKVGSKVEKEECEFDLSFEEFVEYLDDNPDLYQELSNKAEEDSPTPVEEESEKKPKGE